MARCGVDRIDNLFAGATATASIAPGDPDRESVAIIQDFLTSHGHRGLPTLAGQG